MKAKLTLMLINMLLNVALLVLPELIDKFTHALQTLAHKSDNKIDDEIVAQIILNKDKIIEVIKQK